MNLIEVRELINSIPKDDKEMIKFYTRKKEELVQLINEELTNKGFRRYTEAELVAILAMKGE